MHTMFIVSTNIPDLRFDLGADTHTQRNVLKTFQENINKKPPKIVRKNDILVRKYNHQVYRNKKPTLVPIFF